MSAIKNKATGEVYPKYAIGSIDEKKFFTVSSEGEKLFFEDKEQYLNWSADRNVKEKTTTSTMERFISEIASNQR